MTRFALTIIAFAVLLLGASSRVPRYETKVFDTFGGHVETEKILEWANESGVEIVQVIITGEPKTGRPQVTVLHKR